MGPAQGGWRSLGISVCLGYKLAAKVDTFKMLPGPPIFCWYADVVEASPSVVPGDGIWARTGIAPIRTINTENQFMGYSALFHSPLVTSLAGAEIWLLSDAVRTHHKDRMIFVGSIPSPSVHTSYRQI